MSPRKGKQMAIRWCYCMCCAGTTGIYLWK